MNFTIPPIIATHGIFLKFFETHQNLAVSVEYEDLNAFHPGTLRMLVLCRFGREIRLVAAPVCVDCAMRFKLSNCGSRHLPHTLSFNAHESNLTAANSNYFLLRLDSCKTIRLAPVESIKQRSQRSDAAHKSCA